jgi:hypothetical protein
MQSWGEFIAKTNVDAIKMRPKNCQRSQEILKNIPVSPRILTRVVALGNSPKVPQCAVIISIFVHLDCNVAEVPPPSRGERISQRRSHGEKLLQPSVPIAASCDIDYPPPTARKNFRGSFPRVGTETCATI